mgnify:CR=1 FL=1
MIKKNKTKAIVILVIIAVLMFFTLIKIENINKIELIQLSPRTKGQMMGYIIKTKNDKMIVIDGGLGEDAKNLLKYIQNHDNKVDYWFLTHNHNDHAGAFVEIMKSDDVQVDNIYVSLNEKEWYQVNEPTRAEFSEALIDTLNEEKIKDKVKSPELNEIINIDDINVEILGIRNPEFTENPGNEQSMVIKFDTGKTKLLILGDTGEKSSEKLLLNQKDKLKSDIVQMAHHGQAGATEELYKAVNPTICLWPTPEWLWNNDNGNGYGSGNWKTLEVRKWIDNIGVRENYVEKDGDIILKIK